LAGSFTNWQDGAFAMVRSGGGWVAKVKLPPGPHYYKFLVNNRWMTDPDNAMELPDGEGNINSVFFVPNAKFRLAGFANAKNVYLGASFNNYTNYQLPLQKQPDGWMVNLYVAQGTHQYYFWVDGNKVMLNANGEQQQMEARVGKPHLFTLKGFDRAKNVILSGNFNMWSTNALRMQKTTDGWELPYVLGPGNYQYKFIVDGQWIVDPHGGPPVGDGMGNQNSFLVIGHNYTFTLAGYPNAKSVMVAGDFNDWNPNISSMKKVDGMWIGQVFLARGKHRYKFMVDGKWISDPDNKLWEENEHHTGNSILWKD
jgi:1,4-alpha-glucan branching enzyme